MANQLTHALAPASVMALFNVLLGLEPVSWSIFVAAAAGMLMNLDRGDCRVSRGGPACNSLAGVLFLSYLAFMGGYICHLLANQGIEGCMLFSLAVSAGIIVHYFVEIATGQQVFLFPVNLEWDNLTRPHSYSSHRFWSSWSRTCLGGRCLRDVEVNTLSLAAIILAIGIF